MATNSAPILSQSPAYPRPETLSPNFTSRLLQQSAFRHPFSPSNPSKFASLRTQSSPFTPTSSSISIWRGFGGSSLRFRGKGMEFVRVSPLTDSGSGRIGGSGGLSGGGGGGGGGDDGVGGGGDSDSNSPLLWYLDLLAKYPVLTKAITSGLLNCIGDIICQLAINKAPSLDYRRTFMFTFLGMVLVGPTLHFWYLYLSKLITRPGASGAVMRLLLDQFLFSPTFIGVFLSALVTLEGRPSEVIATLKQEWFPSVIANWQLWVPFQFFNFRFVPQQFQVLAANFIAVIWNVILSYRAHKEVVHK